MRQLVNGAVKGALLKATVPLRCVQDVRRELHLMTVRMRRRVDPSWRARERALRKLDKVCLHVGCGPRYLPGWLNLDGWPQASVDFICDFRDPMPLADASCRLIYTDHVLDAIDTEFRLPLLRELHRVLEVGGTLRIVVPDCGRVAEAYVRGDRQWFAQATSGASPGDGLNRLFYHHSHRYLDDFETLSRALAAAGFHEIEQSTHRGSAIEELRVDTDAADRKLYNLYVEARKR